MAQEYAKAFRSAYDFLMRWQRLPETEYEWASLVSEARKRVEALDSEISKQLFIVAMDEIRRRYFEEKERKDGNR